ncbi:MAG: yqeC [Clostridiales bacterium]|jgi:probable selenium-dependent hydroxylase accessory protein YqeC|nr:yqeC [Clostridiales bacterium]
MRLNKLLDLNSWDLVSIVGAGGKTSLMFTLAEELRKEYKLLVTTTTKIFVPEKKQYDYIAIGLEGFVEIKCSNKKGIYVYGDFINDEGKLLGISLQSLNEKFSCFDYTLVEADGSKGKPIKGWNKTEPVISNYTTKTIGVLSIEAIGKEINENNVHRVSEFLNITNAAEDGLISIENIISLIFHSKGLFKGSVGEKILFINKVETNEQKILAKELMHYINIENGKSMLIDRIIYGSLKNREYIQA